MTVLLAVKDKPSPSEEAVRKDSAVHVSLSSDSLVKQPGSLAASTSRRTGKPTNLGTSEPYRRLFLAKSEELLETRHRARKRTARRMGGLYGLSPGGVN
jgi:hypothetical protein